MMTKIGTKEQHVYCRDGVGMEGFPMPAKSVAWSREGDVCWVPFSHADRKKTQWRGSDNNNFEAQHLGWALRSTPSLAPQL